jgi:hypothetical protein
MAGFNPKKLQVFVSSTFDDLKPERQAAVEAILTAGHIPAGMELFTAGDESQMEVIKQWIDESDVYLLILGGRYGSTEPKTRKSYIQLEYEYAISKSKAFFACVIKDEAIEKRVKAQGREVIEIENPQKLKKLRAQVLTKACKFWEDTKDIKIAITEKLSQIGRREDLTGWVRPNTQPNVPALADEIARLSKENAQLHSQLAAIAVSSHMADTAFKKHVEFCEEYAAKIFESLDTLIRVGATAEAQKIAYGLSKIRRKFVLWQTEDVALLLGRFEQALWNIGADNELLQSVTDDSERPELIRRIYEKFNEVMGFELKPLSDKPTSEIAITNIIACLQDHLGVSKLTNLRKNCLDEAVKEIKL